MRFLKVMAATLAAGMMMAAVAPAANAKWLAVAVGVNSHQAGGSVSANNDTKPEAIRNALNSCLHGYECYIISVVEGPGCAFVISGVNFSTGQARESWGATPSEAVSTCNSDGYQCTQPTGDCNE